MSTSTLFPRSAVIITAATIAAIVVHTVSAHAQQVSPGPGQRSLTLSEALDLARRTSPELTATREAVSAAAARERQAGAFPNPTVSIQREQTSGGGTSNSQNIASVDQPLETGGVRRARVDGARLRREAASERLRAAEGRLDLDVRSAYAKVQAADRRLMLAERATTAFARAGAISEARLGEGDISGYANRRVRLEAARYAVLAADARLNRRTARLELGALLGSAELGQELESILVDTLAGPGPVLAADSLRALANRHRAELRVATLEADAAAADARLAVRERTLVPQLTVGIKNERVASEKFNGFVAGVALPLPLWDRRRGAIDAAGADARRRVAEAETVRRRIAREVSEAVEMLRAVEEQLVILRPQLGAESEKALRSAEVAYAEGEITLLEWLDSVRAYQEAESIYANLRAEVLVRRAALEYAVGTPLAENTR